VSRRRPPRWLLAAFVLAAAVTAFFALRMVVAAIRWSDPELRDQPIAGWMTPRYVAMSWQVPPEVIAEALEADAGGSLRGRTLEQIAAARGIPADALAEALKDAITAYRAAADG